MNDFHFIYMKQLFDLLLKKYSLRRKSSILNFKVFYQAFHICNNMSVCLHVVSFWW